MLKMLCNYMIWDCRVQMVLVLIWNNCCASCDTCDIITPVSGSVILCIWGQFLVVWPFTAFAIRWQCWSLAFLTLWKGRVSTGLDQKELMLKKWKVCWRVGVTHLWLGVVPFILALSMFHLIYTVLFIPFFCPVLFLNLYVCSPFSHSLLFQCLLLLNGFSSPLFSA